MRTTASVPDELEEMVESALEHAFTASSFMNNDADNDMGEIEYALKGLADSGALSDRDLKAGLKALDKMGDLSEDYQDAINEVSSLFSDVYDAWR